METRYEYFDVASHSRARFQPSVVTLQDHAAWVRLRLEHWEGGAGETPDAVLSQHAVVINTGRSVRCSVRLGSDQAINRVFEPDTVTIIPAGARYSSQTTGYFSGIVLLVSPDATPNVATNVVELQPRFSIADALVVSSAHALANDVKLGHPFGGTYGDTIAAALWIHLACKYGDYPALESEPVPDFKSHSAAKSLVSAYINDLSHDEIRITDLAALLRMEPDAFARWFKRNFGLPPHQYLLRVRINKAKQLISKERISLLDVALRCGFRSHSHFTWSFRQQTGTTPTKYRESMLLGGAG